MIAMRVRHAHETERQPRPLQRTPAKGQNRIAQGHRPLRGVVHVLFLFLTTRAFRLRLVVL